MLLEKRGLGGHNNKIVFKRDHYQGMRLWVTDGTLSKETLLRMSYSHGREPTNRELRCLCQLFGDHDVTSLMWQVG
mgnify:FL=1